MKWKQKATLISILVGASLLGVWMIFGGAGLPEVANRPASYAIDDGDGTTLGDLFDTQLTGRGGKSGVFLLANGLDAFVARAVWRKWMKAVSII